MKYEAYREIHESYKEMQKTMAVVNEHESIIQSLFECHQEIILLGCGSSYWACLSIANTFRKYTDKRVSVLKAAEVAMDASTFVKGYGEEPLLVTPSRSGESKELLESIVLFKKYYPKSKLFAITEFEHNTLRTLADVHISIPFVQEISVCQTRSFNCLYTAMMNVVSIISEHQIGKDFETYLKKAPKYYEEVDAKVRKLVEQMEHPEIVVLGSGIGYGAAIEGAYIIMEMAQNLTNYFQTLEYRHGPIVTANENTYGFIVATQSENYQKELQMGLEMQRQGANVIFIANEQEEDLLYDSYLLDSYGEEVKGIYATMILQHLAYYLALKQHRNPDQPGDLVKFITY